MIKGTKKALPKFKIEIDTKFQDSKRNITITDREYRIDKDGCNRKWYKYHCNQCTWDGGWIIENHLLKGVGCSCCANRTAVLGINTIWDTDKWMTSYIGEYISKTHTHCSSDNCYPTCPDCGREKSKKMQISWIYKTHSIGCSCGDGISYPNKTMYSVLEQLGITFETEYSPEWIKPKRYDFYIQSMNKIIEMDRGLGHGKEDNLMNGESKEESQTKDDYKDNLAKEYGIEVIRIDCYYEGHDRFEFIQNNILNNYRLNGLFNLSKIDWNKCDEFASSNLVKVACEYWSNGICNTAKIGDIMNLHRTTVIRWLKRGTKLGLCDYDANEESYKNSSKAGVLKGKSVEIFKDGISLGTFPSCRELERQSEKLFGIKLNNKNISQVCNGDRKTHKGYTYKYNI